MPEEIPSVSEAIPNMRLKSVQNSDQNLKDAKMNDDAKERDERFKRIEEENKRLREEARNAEINKRMAEHKAIREENKRSNAYAWLGLIALILVAIIFGGWLGEGR